MEGREQGEQVTWWATRIAAIARDANAVLDAIAEKLKAFELTTAAAIAPDVRVAGRRLLLAGGEELVHGAIVLEAHLVPSTGAGFPLLVAASARFTRGLSPRTVALEFAMDPPFERMLTPESPLSPKRIALSSRAQPMPFISDLRLRAWSLLELEDDAVIASTVVPAIGEWLR